MNSNESRGFLAKADAAAGPDRPSHEAGANSSWPLVQLPLGHVEVDPVSGCWEWTGPRVRGYGVQPKQSSEPPPASRCLAVGRTWRCYLCEEALRVALGFPREGAET